MSEDLQGGEFGSGSMEGCFAQAEAQCSFGCWWCEDSRVCVLHWGLCTPVSLTQPHQSGMSGSSTLLVVVIAAVVLAGIFLLTRGREQLALPLTEPEENEPYVHGDVEHAAHIHRFCGCAHGHDEMQMIPLNQEPALSTYGESRCHLETQPEQRLLSWG
mmetsp:Transcript_31911/g.61407  ORF Transcript_31911/g.61407 Transcript_31911/m.61407 type:complete len:159 (-) Transcript_31911:252-728(-)|eukprot:6181092-Pleurochrysis_carterae.AAC.3